MNSIVRGNLKSLPKMPERKGKNFAYAARLWVIGDVGEAVALWALREYKFRRIIKPLLLQYKEKDKIRSICHFISPNQIRQGVCFLPSMDEKVYNCRVFNEEQQKYNFTRWDFLALKTQRENNKFITHPCLIEVKTHRAEAKSRDYETFKNKDFSKESSMGFRIFCLKIVLRDNWDFEAELEEL